MPAPPDLARGDAKDFRTALWRQLASFESLCREFDRMHAIARSDMEESMPGASRSRDSSIPDSGQGKEPLVVKKTVFDARCEASADRVQADKDSELDLQVPGGEENRPTVCCSASRGPTSTAVRIVPRTLKTAGEPKTQQLAMQAQQRPAAAVSSNGTYSSQVPSTSFSLSSSQSKIYLPDEDYTAEGWAMDDMSVSRVTLESTGKRSKMEDILQYADIYEQPAPQPRKSVADAIKDSLVEKNRRELQTVFLDSVMGVVILANCVCIGLSQDVAVGNVAWVGVDIVFTTLFVLEFAMKLEMLGPHEYVFGTEKYWHLFEFSLMVLALFEVIVVIIDLANNKDSSNASGVSLLRLLRLVRISRLIRVCQLKAFQGLLVMIKGTIGGTKTLMWSAVLICVPLYAVSLIFRETLGNREGLPANLFRTVPLSFFTSFRCVVGGECADLIGRPIFGVVAANYSYGWCYAVVFCIVQFFMIFGLFNVIVAIFVENVVHGARTNEAMIRRQRLVDRKYFAEKMLQLVTHILALKEKDDETDSQQAAREMMAMPQPDQMNVDVLIERSRGIELTPQNFDVLLDRQAVCDILRDLDVADEDTLTLFSTLDVDGSGTIDMEELCDGIARLRGDARRGDIVGVSIMLQKIQEELQQVTEASEAAAESLQRLSRGRSGSSEWARQTSAGSVRR